MATASSAENTDATKCLKTNGYIESKLELFCQHYERAILLQLFKILKILLSKPCLIRSVKH